MGLKGISKVFHLRATLDKGPKSKVQWNWPFLLVQRPLNKGQIPRQIKLWFSLHDIILEVKPIGPDKKKSLNEVHGLENQSVS
jgi:hypothetical protein